jgi:hypothetical protein
VQKHSQSQTENNFQLSEAISLHQAYQIY